MGAGKALLPGMRQPLGKRHFYCIMQTDSYLHRIISSAVTARLTELLPF